MNTIQHYKSYNKLNYIFKKAWKLGFNHPHIYGNKAQKLYRVIQQSCFKNNNVELLNVQFDFLEIIPCIHTPSFNDKMSKINSYFYTKVKKEWVCWEQPLIDKIEECLTEKKVLIQGPNTLAAFLDTVRVGHHYLKLNSTAEKVAKVVRKIQSEFNKFDNSTSDVEKKLENSLKEVNALKTRINVLGRTLNRGAESLEDIDDKN